MLLTPKLCKRNTTEGTATSYYSHRLTERLTERSSVNRSSLFSSGSNRSLQNSTPVTKMTISIKKQKVEPHSPSKKSPTVKVNPAKFRANIHSKMSTESHGVIHAYGISTYKGYRNVSNPHHLGIHLGFVKNLMLVEGYDGTLAGKTIKQIYPIQLIKLMTKQLRDKPEIFVKEAYNKVQDQLTKEQINNSDNSGASLASVVISEQIITAANVGASQVLCFTKKSSLLALNEPHTTENQKELERIVKNGGRVYRTVVNVPNEEELSIQGPIRLSPSGLFYTRTMGKALDIRNQEKQVEQISPRKALKKDQRRLTWMPELNFIKTEDVIWLGIFSESVAKNLTQKEIQDIINDELTLKSNTYTDHHVAMESSRKIVSKVIHQGVPDSVSAMVFIFPSAQSPTNSKAPTPRPINLQLRKIQKQKEKQQSPFTRPTSLKYIGNRQSFIKDHASQNKKDQ